MLYLGQVNYTKMELNQKPQAKESCWLQWLWHHGHSMSVSSGFKEGIRQKLERVQRRVALRVCGGYGTYLSTLFSGEWVF